MAACKVRTRPASSRRRATAICGSLRTIFMNGPPESRKHTMSEAACTVAERSPKLTGENLAACTEGWRAVDAALATLEAAA